MKLGSVDDLLLHELQDLHSAEQQLIKALPTMAESASSPELRHAFETHLKQTREHLRRLDGILGDLGLDGGRHKCKAMEGLLAEANEILKADALDSVRDAAIISAVQRVEHYEIAGYGAARTFAEMLGLASAAELLQQTLDEEKEADELLSALALSDVNLEAQSESEVMGEE